MKNYQSQAHVKREYKYHFVIVLKYRQKALYGKLRRRVGGILKDPCRQKGIGMEEGRATADHIHMLLSVP